MKVLLCTSGTRGDVQPILALAIELRLHGHGVRLCVPCNFKKWIESYGIEHLPIDPNNKFTIIHPVLEQLTESSLDERRSLVATIVRHQFPALSEAALGCDLIVAGGRQLAGPSVAEMLKIPYVVAEYCPACLPSDAHPPLRFGSDQHAQSLSASRNATLWEQEKKSWNDLLLDVLNQERARAGLAPIRDAQHYLFTDRPWLAADSALAPAAKGIDMQVVQRGAWLLPSSNSLPDRIEQFLADGEPPVYFGFGSMPAAGETSRVLIEAARALGLRSILSQGWGNLRPVDTGSDCLSIGDVDHGLLLPRVAAVVHHGGAGTTTSAARAGKAQVIVPHACDQYYWARRVHQLGIGVAGPSWTDLSVQSITAALRQCMRAGYAARALTLASRIERDGAKIAAVTLVKQFGGIQLRGAFTGSDRHSGHA